MTQIWKEISKPIFKAPIYLSLCLLNRDNLELCPSNIDANFTIWENHNCDSIRPHKKLHFYFPIVGIHNKILWIIFFFLSPSDVYTIHITKGFPSQDKVEKNIWRLLWLGIWKSCLFSEKDTHQVIPPVNILKVFYQEVCDLEIKNPKIYL